MANISAILLAGGKSKRFGTDKKKVRLNNTSLLDIAVNKLHEVTNELIIVVSPGDELPHLEDNIVYDSIPDRGPLVGIYSGLKKVNNLKSIVIPIDTPFITIEFLNHMIESSENFDAVIPYWNNKPEPLIGIYSKNLLGELHRWIISGSKLAPHLFLKSLNSNRINYIIENKIKEFGNPEKLFLNINTIQDLDDAYLYSGQT